MLSLPQIRAVAVAACANFAWLAATGRLDPMSVGLAIFCIMLFWAGREDLVYRREGDRFMCPQATPGPASTPPSELYARLETLAWNRLSARNGFEPSRLHAIDAMAVRLAPRFPDAGAALLVAEFLRSGEAGGDGYPERLPPEVANAASLLVEAENLTPAALAEKAASNPLAGALLVELALSRLARNSSPEAQAREGEILYRLHAR